MIIRQCNSLTSDIVGFNFKNVSGATMTVAKPVCFVVADGASCDNISAVQDTTSDLVGWAGIAKYTVANNGYGVTQSWGLYAGALNSSDGTSVTFTLGDALIPNANLGLSSVIGTLALHSNGKYAITAASVTVSTTGGVDCLLRTLG